MKLCDVRSIDPEIVLRADPGRKAFTLHRLSANLDGHFRQDLFGQLKVRKNILPALFIGTFRRTTRARQASLLLETDIFLHEMLSLATDFVIAVCKALDKVFAVATAGQHAMDDLKIRERGWINIED